MTPERPFLSASNRFMFPNTYQHVAVNVALQMICHLRRFQFKLLQNLEKKSVNIKYTRNALHKNQHAVIINKDVKTFAEAEVEK